MMVTTGSTCAATTRRGERCQAWPMNGRAFCFWHDPGTVKERKEARQRGGQARHGRTIGTTGDAGPVVITDAADTLPILAEAINDMRQLENSVGRGRGLGYLCGVMIKAFEVSELESRVANLERQLTEGNR